MSLLQKATKVKPSPFRRLIFYGPPGIGKTTFAASAPSPIFIQTEDGMALQKGLENANVLPLCKTTKELDDYLDALAKEKHDYKTVILDSLDFAEDLKRKELCKKHDKESLQDFGWQSGFGKVTLWFSNVIDKLDLIREKGIHIILLAHEEMSKVPSPDMDSYLSYSLKIHKDPAKLFESWADEIFFANFKVFTREDKDKRTKGIGGKERVFYTQNRVTHLGKNRLSGMPYEMSLPEKNGWESYAKYFETKGDK